MPLEGGTMPFYRPHYDDFNSVSVTPQAGRLQQCIEQ